MLPWLLLLVLPVLSVAAIYFYFWNRSQFFKRRGIVGPQPTSVFTGSLEELQKNNTPHLQILEWEKQYGDTFGYFDGGSKMIVTSDLDVLHDVFIRKFENFYGRKTIALAAIDPDNDEQIDVFSARGLRWKRLRTITNPSFSAAKLKAVEPIIHDSIHGLMQQFEKRTDQPIDVFQFFQELTLDVIERVALGKKKSHFGSDQNPLLVILQKFFNPPPATSSFITSFFEATPEFAYYTRYISKALMMVHDSPIGSITKRLQTTVNDRRQEHLKGVHGAHTDFIEIFLNAEAEEEDMKRMANERNQDIERKHLKVDKKLTVPEIIGQCQVFLLAGFDTTANTLAYMSYHLATNETVQDKLIAEIDDFIHSENDITYDSVQNLTYLDWCVKESLRLNPLAQIASHRMCMKTCTVGERQLQLEEGTIVQANVWSIHYNKKVWGDDADCFRPERFDPETLVEPRHPLAWQPFGGGPRTCIGMRFALLETKTTMCYLLKRFKIEKCNKTKLVRSGNLSVSPSDVTVILKKRG